MYWEHFVTVVFGPIVIHRGTCKFNPPRFVQPKQSPSLRHTIEKRLRVVFINTVEIINDRHSLAQLHFGGFVEIGKK